MNDIPLTKDKFTDTHVMLTNAYAGFAADDRGILIFNNELDMVAEGIKRFYVVKDFKPGTIRAWHEHTYERKWIIALTGSVLVGVVAPIVNEVLIRKVLTAGFPEMISVPRGCANGLMSLEPHTTVLIFSDRTIEESKTDDIRHPYDKWNIWNVENR